MLKTIGYFDFFRSCLVFKLSAFEILRYKTAHVRRTIIIRHQRIVVNISSSNKYSLRSTTTDYINNIILYNLS